MRIKNIFLSLVFILCFSTVGHAAGCYTGDEFESEQGLRIHSELMVIGLTCQKVPGGHGLYNKYRKFTNKNQYLLGQYEDILLAYYRNHGQNPERSLHNLRTNIANEISQKAIQMNMAAFCRHYGGRIDEALDMDHYTLRRWARQKWATQSPSQPLCRSY